MYNIKCPNCGSSAQIKVIDPGEPTFKTMFPIYKCGCGCKFEVIFRAAETNVIK